MNKIKKAFLRILQGKVIFDDDIVPVVIKDYRYDATPCITIQGFNRDKGEHPRQLIKVKRALSKTHPLYNEEKPKKRYPHLAESTRKSYEVQLNVWCNDERQREEIVDQVKQLLFLCRNSHYMFCMNYNNETHECRTLGSECKARLDMGYHGLRGLCPKPRDYHCCPILNHYNIIKNTIVISPDEEKDEHEHKPPLKRSIITIDLDYYEINVFDGNPFYCFDVAFDENSSTNWAEKLNNL